MSQALANNYKYITMIKIEDKPKTSVFAVESKYQDQLGVIKWFPRWRQYCFLFWKRWSNKSKLDWVLSLAVSGSDYSIEMFIEEKQKAGSTWAEAYNQWELITKCRCIKHLDYWIGQPNHRGV